MKKKKRYRILISPQEIAGFMLDIKKACEDLNIPCQCWSFYNYPAGDERDYYVKQLVPYFYIVEKVNKHRKKNNTFMIRLLQIPEALYVLYLFAWSLFHFDIYIFVYNRGMFDTSHYLKKTKEVEFWILKKCRKNILFWCVGSDTRPPYCDGYFKDCSAGELNSLIKEKFSGVRLSEKYGLMIDNPASAHFHTKPYINYLYFGLPVYINKKQQHNAVVGRDNNRKDTKTCTILHAPSHRATKGSDEIEIVIQNLQKKYDINFIEITNKKNVEVIETIKNADIVIDQLYTDTVCPKISVEASLEGVPSILGSNMAEELNSYPRKDVPPTYICSPDYFEKGLEELIKNKELRHEIGMKEKEFIENNWDARKVVKKLIKVADGYRPSEYIVDPHEAGNMWGYGQNKSVTVKQIHKIVKSYGTKGLRLKRGTKLYNEYLREIRKVSEEASDAEKA